MGINLGICLPEGPERSYSPLYASQRGSERGIIPVICLPGGPERGIIPVICLPERGPERDNPP